MDRDLKYQYQWQHRCINNWSWKKWHDSVEQSWTMQYHVCHCFWCTKEHYFHQGIDLKFYYHKAGIDKAQKQSNKWNAQLLDLMEGRSIHHFKTSDYKEYISSIAFYGENYKNLWNSHAVTKKWSLQNFFLYCSKNSVINKFLGSSLWSICPSIWSSCDALWGWFLCIWRSWWTICPIEIHQEEMHPLFWVSQRKWIQDISDLSRLQKMSPTGLRRMFLARNQLSSEDWNGVLPMIVTRIVSKIVIMSEQGISCSVDLEMILTIAYSIGMCTNGQDPLPTVTVSHPFIDHSLRYDICFYACKGE